MAVDNSPQGRLRILQANGMGDSIAARNLMKQIGTQPVSPTLSVNQARYAENVANTQVRNAQRATDAYNNSDDVIFNKTWNAYIQAQKDAYGIETARGLEKYGQQRQDLTTSYNKALQGYDYQSQDTQRQNARDLADYHTFTGQEQKEFNRNLALRDKNFGSAMSNASNAYGQRGILRSGVALKKSAESMSTFSEDTTHFKLQEQQKLDTAALAMNRVAEDYNTNMGRIGTNKQQTTDLYNTQLGRIGTDTANFQTDQSARTAIGVNALQAQGDQLYNQASLAKYQLTREQNMQNAQDKLYGTTTQPIRFKLRSGGTYSY